MTIGPISSPSFNTGITFGQDAAAVQADEVATLLNATFGATSDGSSITTLLPGSSASSGQSSSDMTSLLEAYTASKSLTPVALAYLQGTAANSTMTTLL